MTFGMNSVVFSGRQPFGVPSGSAGLGSTPQVNDGSPPPWARTGKPAAAMAAGLVEVWSTIRLLITRGSESTTLPDFCLYDDGPGAPTGNSGVIGSASRKSLELIRGKPWSAEPLVPWPSMRLLQDPSTVRRPLEISGLGIWSGPLPTSVPHRLSGVCV